MLGLLAWTFFASSASMSTGAIVDNGGLVKSVLFPRAILPTATVLFNLAQYVLSVLVILPLMLLWYRVPPAAPMLLFPVFVALQLLFTIGVALIAGDRRRVSPRRPPLRRNRAHGALLDDADRLRGAEVTATAPPAHPAQPDVALRGRVSGDLLLSNAGRTPGSGRRRSAMPSSRWRSGSG